MQNLSVVIALEQEFGVSFGPEDFEAIHSVESLEQLLQGKLPD